MTDITLETIQARQDELAAMIAEFNANKSRTINLPAATIELRPGEQYAGLVLKDDGTPSHHLVPMTVPTPARLSWQDAKDWASKAGGELPTQRELSMIYAHCRAHVKHVWYWSGEEFKDDTSSAWGYHFGEGYRNIHPKCFEADVVAVRRIPIPLIHAAAKAEIADVGGWESRYEELILRRMLAPRCRGSCICRRPVDYLRVDMHAWTQAQVFQTEVQ